MPAQGSVLTVSETVSRNPDSCKTTNDVKPSHWVGNGKSFRNPWESYRRHTILDLLCFMSYPSMMKKHTKGIGQCLSVRKPTWGENQSWSGDAEDSAHDKIKATWLGHACFLVEFPSRDSSQGHTRGIRILFDPALSDRCSPIQYIGPKRYTPPPCTVEEIPEIDAVVISHNHYDHLDTRTILSLIRRTKRTPHFFAPLGNLSFFQKLGIPKSNIHTMDWWDSKRLEVSFDGNNKRIVDITCTPSQHFTGRTLWDHFKTLWASWVVEESALPNGTNPALRSPVKVYFAGDTAYRTVLDGEDEDKVPFCPVFEEIGNTFGGFDFAMIPIGAYLPRKCMSRIHCAPQDSVRLFKDIRAKRAIGMHWGTWVLTVEDVTDPPRRLAEECSKLGIEDAFATCDIGETVFL